MRRGLAKYSKKTNLKISQWVNPQGCRLESLKRNGGGVNGQSLTSGRGPIGGDMLLCWGWNWFSYLHTVSVSTSSPSSSSLFCSDSCLLHKLWRETIFGAVKRGGLCVCRCFVHQQDINVLYTVNIRRFSNSFSVCFLNDNVFLSPLQQSLNTGASTLAS